MQKEKRKERRGGKKFDGETQVVAPNNVGKTGPNNLGEE